MNGMRIRFETKPGKSRASAGVLPRSTARAVIAAAVSSEVSRPRITSTSFSTGTGLKKCMPITRSGRDVAAASDVIGIDEVFDARIASGGKTASAARKIASFTFASSTTASIIRSAATSSVRRRDPREHLVRIGAALVREPRQALAHRLEAALDRPGRRVVKRDPAAGRRDDLCDPTAHLAGADDENVLEVHAREAIVGACPRRR